MLQHITKLRVRYADTDQMQIVYYGKYLEYFEVARTEMLRAYGLPYRKIEENGFLLPVVEANVKYHSTAKYDDELEIECIVKDFPSIKISIEYFVRKSDDHSLVATGSTVLGFINKETFKVSRMPAFFHEEMKKHFK